MRRSECRRGLHDYRSSTSFGAGLRRVSCEVCGVVNIDLTEEQDCLSNPPNLFVEEEERTSIFAGVTNLDLHPLPV